jgi:folate-binding protein YgfZ
VFLNHYRALTEAAVIGAVAPRSAIGVAGTDRASYLHGLLTNDIQALTPGTGCYAAWLTPQGRMLTDMHVFEPGDMIFLDVPEAVRAATLERLDQFLFSEDVQLADLSSTLTSVWIHGPSAASILEQVLRGVPAVGGWGEYQNARATFGDAPVVVARINQLGVPGFCVYVDRAHEAELQRALESAGAVAAGGDAIAVARIEAGYPLFGVDMTESTIPLEAGIENRAISFTKGCYPGQEVIVRVLHRGHGRVARKLVSLLVDGAEPAHGAKIFSGAREIGFVTSAATSPQFGPVALAYVHRDFVAPGTAIEVDTPAGRRAARVSESPLSAAR